MEKNSKNQNKEKIKIPIESTEEPGDGKAAREEGTESQRAASQDKMEGVDISKLKAQLEEKSREAAENHDKWLRLRAEFENFKKRMSKEKSEMMKFGNESLLRTILPGLDDLERAIDHGKSLKRCDPLLEGVEISYRNFLNILEKFGVKPISAVGEEFNPEKHEAIAQQESDGPANQVLAEVLKGYLFHDRLLRPSRVIVSKAKEGKETEEGR